MRCELAASVRSPRCVGLFFCLSVCLLDIYSMRRDHWPSIMVIHITTVSRHGGDDDDWLC